MSNSPPGRASELSKFRLDQKLRCRWAVAARVSMLRRVSFLTTTVMETGSPLLREGGESAWPNRFSQFGQFCLDRRGRRERLSLIASGGVVDKLMPRSAPYCFGAGSTTPSAPARKAAFFFMAQPPLCAEHVQQLGSESLLSNLMEVKD